MNNDRTAHRTRIEPFDIVKPYVILARVPGFGWVILREDCLAHRTPFGPEGDRRVPRVVKEWNSSEVPPRRGLSQWMNGCVENKSGFGEEEDDSNAGEAGERDLVLVFSVL